MKSPSLSILLMVCGAVTALVFAASPLETSVPYRILFGISLAVLAIGATLRRNSGRTPETSGESHGVVQQAAQALQDLDGALRKTHMKSHAIEDMSLHHTAILEATAPYITEFLKHRQTLLDTLGFGRFAELMISFAAAERMINRCLSASADGVADEAQRCLLRAVHLVDECNTKARDIGLIQPTSTPLT